MARGPVVVLGAAGFLGRRVLQRLTRDGGRVIAVDCHSTLSSAQGVVTSHVVDEVVDIRDTAGLRDLFRRHRPEAVVHLAARHYLPDCIARPELTLSVNVAGTEAVATAAADAGVHRLLFASSAAVYRPSTRPHAESASLGPIDVYGKSKLMGERALREIAGERIRTLVICRLFNIYGPGDGTPHVVQTLIKQLKRGCRVRLGNLRTRRDYLYVEDAACAVTRLLEEIQRPVTVNIGTGRATSVADLVAAMEGLLDQRIVVDEDASRRRALDRPHLQADASRLTVLLPSFAPSPLRRGLRETLRAEGLL